MSDFSATGRRTELLGASNSVVGDAGGLAHEAVVSGGEGGPGDPLDFRALYDRYHQRVFRLVTRMVGSQDAADVSQLVFVRAFTALDDFRGESRIETWLYRVTVNECLQHLRKRARTKEQPLEHDLMDPAYPDSENADERELLERALARLEPELRAVFLLREIEGLSYRQMAESLAISEGTVASRLSRARKMLKQILTELGWTP